MKKLGSLVLIVMTVVVASPTPAPAAENDLKVRPRTVNLGPSPVGQVQTASTTVTNTSSQTVNLTIAATKDWDDFSYGFLPGSTCSTFEPMPLAPGESCVFEIRFLPSTDFLGLKQDQIFRATATDPVTGMVLDQDRFVFYGRAR
jgi:hypothetical protein